MRTSSPEVEALYAAGHWMLSQRRTADAAVLFRAMVEADERDERGWLALGACHEEIAQPALAVVMYDAALEVAAPAPRCAIAKARVLKRVDRDDDAAAALELAVEHAREIDDDELVRLARAEMGR